MNQMWELCNSFSALKLATNDHMFIEQLRGCSEHFLLNLRLGSNKNSCVLPLRAPHIAACP